MRKFQIKSLSSDKDANEEVKVMAGDLVTIVSSLPEGEPLEVLGDIQQTAPSTKSEGAEDYPHGVVKPVSAAELFHEAVIQSPETMGTVSIVSRKVKAESHYFHQESLVLARPRLLGLTIFDFDYRFGHDLVADFRLHPAVGAALVMTFTRTGSCQASGHRDVSFLLALWKSLIASTLTDCSLLFSLDGVACRVVD
jgi:hypothetical protein